MKRVLAASVGVLALTAALGTVAGAADLSRGYPAPVRAPYFSPVYNWTGFYLGINGGGGWGRSAWTGVDTFDLSGGLIGARSWSGSKVTSIGRA
jgi:outer membrane immunogenic protein